MTRLSEEHKQQIIALIHEKKKQLGSYTAVANFCDVSVGTIGAMKVNNYKADGDDMWLNVAACLGFKPTLLNDGNKWVLAETTDFKNLQRLLNDVKRNRLWIPISDIAGMGKSKPLEAFAKANAERCVFYMRCGKWGAREFLENMCRCLGVDWRTAKTPTDLLALITSFFNNRSLQRPLMIVDEADKLRDGAKITWIHIYNECEDNMSMVISGTEHLEKQIKRGVTNKSQGMDEIDSRFGRNYIKLIGCTFNDVRKICVANGVSDEKMIKEIFKECGPVNKELEGPDDKKITITVLTDQRRLKRSIQKRLILSNQEQQ